MYNIIMKPNVKPKSTPSRQQSAPSGKAEKDETEQTEEEKAKFEGLRICPVSGDSSKACNKMACLSREKVKYPHYLINKPKTKPDITTELPGRSRSDVMNDKSPKSEKPKESEKFPRSPPTMFPLPPKRDPLEEQQRRATLTEYRQRLKRYHEE